MASKTQSIARDPTAAVFARAWATIADKLPHALARHVLQMSFSQADQARMHHLATQNVAGKLTSAEQAELDGYIRAGDMIAILQSSARRKIRAGANGHG